MENNKLQAGWLETYSGLVINPLDPNPADININDIAHALSHTCRFAGHCKEFYSVAQHSVYVSRLATNAFEGLMHDATEYLMCDLPRPIKHLPQFSFYKELEDSVWKTIAKKYGLKDKISTDTKTADYALLLAEKRDIMSNAEWDIPKHHWQLAYPEKIKPLYPTQAKIMFLERFNELYVI